MTDPAESAFAKAKAVRAAPAAYGARHVVAGPSIPFTSAEGEARLIRCHAKAEYFPLSATFITQETQTLCSVASSVMVLNTLPIEKPVDPVFDPYPLFTQRTFFTPAVSALVSEAAARDHGMTLDEAARALAAHGVTATAHRADQTSEAQFRENAARYLSHTRHYVIANFLRGLVGEEGHGHFSPLGAYDEESDSLLVMDVARYKYPPLWIATKDLFAAMQTTDRVSGQSRGYITVSAAR